jgi:hypothetical protein
MSVARLKAWQCVGCGRIESQETCLGVCHDVPVHVVSAADYDAVRAELDALRLFVRQVALVRPRDGEWERTGRAIQARARRLLCPAGEDTVQPAAV